MPNLSRPMATKRNLIKTDVLVIGSGAAGLMATLNLDPRLEVTLLSKRHFDEGSTKYAQGGVACVIDGDDSLESHIEDTHYAGDGLCDSKAVKVLTKEGPEVIGQLMDWMDFDRNSRGEIRLGHEGAHSHRRILHAGGDATGAKIQAALGKKVRDRKRLKSLEHHRLVELLKDGKGRCVGAHVVNTRDGTGMVVLARTVILATGGMSQIFQESTNPVTSSGDGVSAAFELGATIRDPEFIQFHPTALFIAGAPRFLISEAVRGEGAILRNSEGEAFMKDVHSMAELAPRDVVSRAIARQMIVKEEGCVFLDLTHLKSDKMITRFPTITACCSRFGIDISKQWIPVRPAAHYSMGGVATDMVGRTDVPGLFACGEVASTGVHGANRLASNSLLEALVFGRRVGEAISGGELPKLTRSRPQLPPVVDPPPVSDPEDLIRTLRAQMWRRVGVFRTRHQMEKVDKRLREWYRLEHGDRGFSESSDSLRHLINNAFLVNHGALMRKESRGAHYREDHPRRDDVNFKRHTTIRIQDMKGSL